MTVPSHSHEAGDISGEFVEVVIRGPIRAISGFLENLTVNGTITLGPEGLIRTAESGARVELGFAVFDRIAMYSGAAGESDVAGLQTYAPGGVPRTEWQGPHRTPGEAGHIQIGEDRIYFFPPGVSSDGSWAIWLDGSTDRVWVWVNGSLKQVTQGDVDSGGTGFRVLRVQNDPGELPA